MSMDLSYHHNVLTINNAAGTFELSTLFGSAESIQGNMRSLKWRAAVREAYGVTLKRDLIVDSEYKGNFYASPDGTLTCTTIGTTSPLRVVEVENNVLVLDADGQELYFSLTESTPRLFQLPLSI